MKKKLFLFGGIGAAVVVAAVVLILTLGKKGYRSIIVIEVSGNVTVTRDGQSIDAYPQMKLRSGDGMVVTGGGYARLKMDDDKYVFLEENTVISLEAAGTAAKSRTIVYIEQGKMLTEIRKKLSSDSSYDIVTPNTTMAIRGTATITNVKQANADPSKKIDEYNGEENTPGDGNSENYVLCWITDNYVIEGQTLLTIFNTDGADILYRDKLLSAGNGVQVITPVTITAGTLYVRNCQVDDTRVFWDERNFRKDTGTGAVRKVTSEGDELWIVPIGKKYAVILFPKNLNPKDAQGANGPLPAEYVQEVIDWLKEHADDPGTTPDPDPDDPGTTPTPDADPTPTPDADPTPTPDPDPTPTPDADPTPAPDPGNNNNNTNNNNNNNNNKQNQNNKPAQQGNNTTNPDQGNTTDPEQGNTTDPEQGNTTDPEQGNTTDPEQGNTTDPEQGNTTDPNQGNTTEPVQGDIKDPENGKTPVTVSDNETGNDGPSTENEEDDDTVYSAIRYIIDADTVQEGEYEEGKGLRSLLQLDDTDTHEFVCWNDADGNEVSSIPATATGTQTLFAFWEPRTFNIYYHVGDSFIEGDWNFYTYGDSVTPEEFPDYSNDYYSLRYWADNSENGPATKGISSTDYGDKHFYAVFGPAVYTITYYTEPGVLAKVSEEYETYEAGVGRGCGGGAPSLPTLADTEMYTFFGWALDAESDVTDYIGSEDCTDVELYALWKPRTYTITYYSNGQKVATERYTTGSEITLRSTDTAWYEPGKYDTGLTTLPYGTTGNKILYEKQDDAYVTIVFLDENGNVYQDDEGNTLVFSYQVGDLLEAIPGLPEGGSTTYTKWVGTNGYSASTDAIVPGETEYYVKYDIFFKPGN